MTNRNTNGKIKSDSPYYDLIQRAYQVFKQQGPVDLGVCDCCMEGKIRQDFFNHGQKDLPFRYVQDWFFAAADIPLNRAIWRYLLPRILEVLASGEEPSNCDIAVSLYRFPTGNPKQWTSKEWEVLDEFQRLFLYRVDDHEESLDDVLCTFALAGWSTDDLFAQVDAWPVDKLINQLWNDWCRYGRPGIWTTAFWEDESIPMALYTSQALLDKIINYALSLEQDTELTDKALAIAEIIERSRQSH